MVISPYEDFPSKIYPIFDNLRENRCENIVEMITQANDRIKSGMNTINNGPWEGFKTRLTLNQPIVLRSIVKYL